MSDEIYYRQRAKTEARRAEMAAEDQARSVHEALRKAYLERAEAICRGGTTAH